MPSINPILRIALFTVFALFSIVAYAEPDQRHIVSLSASASQATDNDTVTVLFAAKAQGSDPADVIQQINRQMRRALELLEDEDDIILQTGSYRVNPVYEKNRLTLWRGTQSLSLQTQNLDRLPDLLTRVQKFIPYQSMRFSLSTAERQRIEKELIPVAINNLKTEAQIAMQSFSARQALPLKTRIQKSTPYAEPLARAMAVQTDAPALQSGQSTVRITVEGEFVFLYQ